MVLLDDGVESGACIDFVASLEAGEAVRYYPEVAANLVEDGAGYW